VATAFASEDDYDDDADGDDIADSEDEEDEEDEGGNDLEYDEFFRHDNDFGSDADSDGEIMAAVAMKSRQGEEKVGLRFLRDESGQWQQHLRGASSSSSRDPQSYGMKVVIDEQAVGQPAIMTACFETEKDVVRLRNYGCVVFATARAMPYLGWTESQPKKSSKAEAAEKEKEEAEILKAVEKAAKSAEKAAKSAEKEAAKAAKVAEKEGKAKEPKAKKEPKLEVPKNMDETLLPALVKLVHGRREGIEKLVADFIADHPTEVKAKVERKLREIADKKKHDEGYGNARWVVKQSVIDSLGLTVGTAVEENDAVFDLAAICYTPPKAKRARPTKEEAEVDAPKPKSARLRGDATEMMKPLGWEWWPEDEQREEGAATAPEASSAKEQVEEEEDEAEAAEGGCSPTQAAVAAENSAMETAAELNEE